jgi:cell division protein ZipA
MENIRWILLFAGVGIVLGIFLISWLPGRLKARPPRRRVRPSSRTRDAMSGEAGINADGMVEAELEKLGQLVVDDAPGEQLPPMCEIRATRPQAAATEVEKVFSLYVLAPKGVPFRGPILLGAMADAGLEYGEMQIFSRHELQGGRERLVFSLASVREPGTFDLSAMQDFSTDGLVLFFQVPGQVDALKAFESMVAAARVLANSLGGTLYDKSHSVMTNQTIGHMREEVIGCQLQQRVAKRAS